MNLVEQRLKRNGLISSETTEIFTVITSLPQFFANLILKIILKIKIF